MKNRHPILRTIALLLALVLVTLPLAACRKKPALDINLGDLAVYDLVEYTVGDQYSYIQSMIWTNGEILALAADNMGLSSVVRLSTTGEILGTVDLSRIPGVPREANPSEGITGYVDGLYAGPNDTFYLTVTDYSDPSQSVRTLYQLDSRGSVLTSFPVFTMKNDGSTQDYLNNIVFTPKGQLVLVLGTKVELLDSNGQKLGEYKLDGQYISLALPMSNGHLSLSYYAQDGIVSEEIDLEAGVKIQDLSLPPQLYQSAPMLGADGLYYLNGYQYLSSYNDQTGEIKKLMSWLDLDVNRNNISYMWIAAPDGSFYFGETIYPENQDYPLYGAKAAEAMAVETLASEETGEEGDIEGTQPEEGTAEEPASIDSEVIEPMPIEPMPGEEPFPTDWTPPANPTFKLVKLTKSADQSAIEKTNIMIGAFWLNEGLRRAIIDYRKVRPDVRFTVIDYSENIDYSKASAYEDAITKINADIIAGKMPDLMLVSNLPWKQYANKGLLTDLGSLMEKDSSFNRDAYLGNYFDASKINDKLYTMSSGVVLTGIVSSRDLVGDRTGWTVQEFQQLVEAQPNPENLFFQMPGESILSMLLMGNLDAYIDTEQGVASFDTPDFIQLLEFANKYGVDPEYFYGKEGNYYEDGEYQFPAFQMAYMSRFEDYAMYNMNYKGQATLLGLPSPQRSGPMLQGTAPLAMAANTRNEKIVWEFIKFMLSEEQQDKLIGSYEGFPILRSSLDKAATTAIETSKKYQQSGGETFDIYYGYGQVVTEADTKAMIGMLSQASQLLSYDEKANQLIFEETQAFFAGNKTAAEAAAAIQSRLKAYIGEQ
jgi:ABC-type glycerol-3-phosphate transport system substrate-binding protein